MGEVKVPLRILGCGFLNLEYKLISTGVEDPKGTKGREDPSFFVFFLWWCGLNSTT
jgi:hypothetical protein